MPLIHRSRAKALAVARARLRVLERDMSSGEQIPEAKEEQVRVEEAGRLEPAQTGGGTEPEAVPHASGSAGNLSDLWPKSVPGSLRGGLLDPGSRSVRGLALVGAAAALLAMIYIWQSRPEPLPVKPVRQKATFSSPTPSPSPSPNVLVVHVGGKVRHPDVYRLPHGSRVIDAVEAAGGAKPGANTNTVNLARPLVDGEQILVGVYPPATGGATGSTGSAVSPESALPPVDLNTATTKQLEELPGIGPVLAERIIEYRTEHGGFGSVEELLDVSGIGEATFGDLEGLVRV